MRHIIAALTAVAVLAAALPAQAAGTQLKDVSNHWARVQIEAGVADGYIAGYPDGTFQPNNPITRAEFFKLLGAAMRLLPSQRNVDFAETDHWAFVQGHIPAAVEAGLINPPDYGSSFGPNAQIRRREIVLAAVRALGKQALVNEKNPVLTVPDAAQYDTWLRGWAAVAMADGIVTGYEDGRIGLERNATRAEALVMVQRILKKVTMELAPAMAPNPNSAEHPGEGEVAWTWDVPANMRPTVTNGSTSYTFTQDAWGLRVLAAPGKAAWLSYTVKGDGDSTIGVVARMQQGKLTEVARYEGGGADLLAVGDDGRLWFSGGQKLLIAYPDGTIETVEGVNERIYLGAVDWNGTLWASGGSKLYRVTPDGLANQITVSIGTGEMITHVAATGGDSVWLLVNSADRASRAQAIQLVNGWPAKRLTLLSRYSGSERVQAVGQSGPFLWVEATRQSGSVGEGQDALFKFDLSTGAFTRQVAPRNTAAREAVAASGSGVLVKDLAGKFWRVLP